MKLTKQDLVQLIKEELEAHDIDALNKSWLRLKIC